MAGVETFKGPCYSLKLESGHWGEKSGPGVTVRPAHLIHGALPTQYTTRCPLKALHVSTSQWPTWKNTHTLNITLDDYKEITSYMFFFITFGLDPPICLDGHME